VLTDAYGLSGWGPYNLWKWSLMAKMRGCRVRFLSVGAGPIYGRLGRFLIGSALRTADGRSYRDRPSMECAKRLGLRTDRDHIRPDLAFGLSPALLPTARETQSGRRVVGLGLMLYAGRYSAADPDPSTYPTYLKSLALFVRWLLESDYDIRLLLGDEDPTVIAEFRSVLHANLGVYDETRITDAPMLSVEEVLAQLAAVDVVVATRFHNLVFSLLLNRPVVAISFHHKCTSLMKDMGLGDYCHDIHDMNVERLLEQFQSLEDNAETVRCNIAAKVDEYRSALDAQYDSLVRGV
jgi:polysaccharide pyruvyl transferase WcaK-like protein